MKRALVFMALTLGIVAGASAQDSSQTVSTSTLDGARFEMIQSPLDKAVAFRLDKFTGTIDRLGTCPKDDGFGSSKCWKEMVVLELPKAAAQSRTRFQIVINVPMKLTMLMQIDTGRTWQLGVDPQDRWAPFIDCTDKSNAVCLWRP
jgi:hypothetical protein